MQTVNEQTVIGYLERSSEMEFFDSDIENIENSST